MEQPGYFAVIPADIRYDHKLKDKAKLLYGEITCLCNKEGYCYASNKYFAELYNVSTRTITDLIKNLIDGGYIECKVIYKEGTKEIIQRRLYLSKNISRGIEENFQGGIEENFYVNNTSINNTSINKYYGNDELNNIFEEYLQLRKKLKMVNTDRAIKMLINKLEPFSDDIKIKMLEQSIEHSWKTVYELKVNEPSWFNQETKKEDLSNEEREELETLMSKFK